MNQQLLSKLMNVNGYIRDDEAELLYELAKKCTGKGVIVEIGSWEGKSTICLGLGIKNRAKTKVYAIDPHTGSSEHQQAFGKVNTLQNFRKNILAAGISELVTPLVMTSHKAVTQVKEPVELLFIDGDHSYEAVKQDFTDWYPKVLGGGLIAFHDTMSWPGPKKVVEDSVFHSDHFRHIRVTGSITVAEKVKVINCSEKVSNYLVLFIKNLRSLISSLHLPKPLHALAKNILRYLPGQA